MGLLWSRFGEVRPGFRAKHNYASRPGRKGGGGFLRKQNRRAGTAQNRYAVYAWLAPLRGEPRNGSCAAEWATP